MTFNHLKRCSPIHNKCKLKLYLDTMVFNPSETQQCYNIIYPKDKGNQADYCGALGSRSKYNFDGRKLDHFYQTCKCTSPLTYEFYF